MIIRDKSIATVDLTSGGGSVTTSTGTSAGTPTVNLSRQITVTWVHTDATPNAVSGFRVVLYTDPSSLNDPNNTANYICPPIEVGPTVGSVIKSVTVATTSTIVKSAVQALYKNGNEGAWRTSSGSVQVDPDTLTIPTAGQVDGKSTVFFQDAVPTSLKPGDAWIDTTTGHGNKMYVANWTGVSSIVTTGHGWYLVQDSDSVKQEVLAVQSDGILSLSEKPAMKSRYDAAISESDIVVRRATSLGVTSSALVSALGAITTFFSSLALGTNTTWWDCTTATGTNITLPDSTSLGTIWTNFDTELTRCIMACQTVRRGINFLVWSGSSPATIDLSNPPTTTPTSIDGVTITDQAKVLLANQTTPSQNGLYTVTIVTTEGTGDFTPSASSKTSGGGTYSTGGTDRDANNTSYETAASSTDLDPSTTVITYSGFSGSATSGTLHFKADVTVFPTFADDASSASVEYSTNSGANWTQFTSGHITTDVTNIDLTASLSGIALGNLQVRITLYGGRLKQGPFPDFYYKYWWCEAKLRAVYITGTSSVAGTVWTKNTNVGAGETYSVIYGTKANYDATVSSVSGTNVLDMIYGPTVGAGGTVSVDKFYTHDQSASSATWSITHGLDKYPSVTIVDSGGTMVVGKVAYTSLTTLSVSFNAPFTGKAYCN